MANRGSAFRNTSMTEEVVNARYFFSVPENFFWMLRTDLFIVAGVDVLEKTVGVFESARKLQLGNLLGQWLATEQDHWILIFICFSLHRLREK